MAEDKSESRDDRSQNKAPEPIAVRPGRFGWVGRALIAVAVVLSAGLIGRAADHFVDARFRDGIRVAGSASVRIRSDRALWSSTVTARGATLAEAYAVLQEGVPRVRRFLIDQGVPEDDVRVGAVSTDELYARNEDGMELREQITGYELRQSVHVTSSDIDLVERVSQDVTQLIEGGVHVTSSAPEYIYTDLDEVKIRLVGEATADARARAEQVAENSQSELGRLVSARVGVVQVNAANETEVAWEGVYNRSSVDKDVMLVVHTMFLVE